MNTSHIWTTSHINTTYEHLTHLNNFIYATADVTMSVRKPLLHNPMNVRLYLRIMLFKECCQTKNILSTFSLFSLFPDTARSCCPVHVSVRGDVEHVTRQHVVVTELFWHATVFPLLLPPARSGPGREFYGSDLCNNPCHAFILSSI